MAKTNFVLTLTAFFILTIAFSVHADQVCYNSIFNIPATCTGSVTSDRQVGGCRVVDCSSGTNTLSIMACDKPGTYNAQYFEMYKRFENGTTPRICLGDTCVQESGFARSTTFPICDGTTILPTNQTNSTTNTSACLSHVNDLPASCTGGTFTTDNKGGCRTLVCTNGGDSMQVQACDKPTSTNPDHFEMYKQSQVGTSVSKICLASTCISNNGFASQNFPVCTGNTTITPPVNNTNQTNTTQTSVSLGIAPWYPQGNNYVLVCNANGFTATSYDWTFGDGQKQLGMTNNNVYHNYNNGSYDATCTAKSNTQLGTGTLHIDVGGNSMPPAPNNLSASITIDPLFPQDQNYVFDCQANGFNATNYSWNFGDGTTDNNRPVIDVYHTFPGNGTFNVTCTATNGSASAQGSTVVHVNIPFPPAPNSPYGLDFHVTQVSNHTYQLFCVGYGYNGDELTRWSISGPGFSATQHPDGQIINFTFPQSGDYGVGCQSGFTTPNYDPSYYEFNSIHYHSNEICRQSGCAVGSPFTIVTVT